MFTPAYADTSAEVLFLAGGPEAVLNRAQELKAQGRIELACQLAEWVVKGEPLCKQGWEVYGLLFKERAEKEFNMQARGAWNSAVRNAIVALENIES